MDQKEVDTGVLGICFLWSNRGVGGCYSLFNMEAFVVCVGIELDLSKRHELVMAAELEGHGTWIAEGI